MSREGGPARKKLGKMRGADRRWRERQRGVSVGGMVEGEKWRVTLSVQERVWFPVKAVYRGKTKWEKPTLTSTHLRVELNRQATLLWRHSQNYNLLSISSTRTTNLGKFKLFLHKRFVFFLKGKLGLFSVYICVVYFCAACVSPGSGGTLWERVCVAHEIFPWGLMWHCTEMYLFACFCVCAHVHTCIHCIHSFLHGWQG